jgi:ABC-2 type transport system ATP-binding protein
VTRRDDTAPVLEADRLERRFGAVSALRGLSLSVRPGEIYGLVGADGAGKTTAMRILAGLMAPDAGTARVLDEDPLHGAATLRSAIGYMPQHYSLYGDLSVEENLRFFSRMFCQSRAEYRERRGRLLQITRLEPFTGRRADALSGGMYKKLALACSLLPRPRVLLLDEPTNGVDPVSRRELWALLFELVANADGGAGGGAATKMGILITTAYMDEAARCHRVGLIHHGRLLVEGPPAELLARFPHGVLEIESPPGAGDLERLVEGRPQVVTTAAAGRRLRVVVRREGLEALEQLLLHAGAEPRQVAPSFEDLFLAATAGREEAR